ncbi:MAG: DEAD/DEAH box helicase [Candidatus Kerfeldbacteria bacterium]|jgi:AAA domain-containing protein
MQNPEFSFKSVLFIARGGDNVFSDQLKRRQIPFTTSSEKKPDKIEGNPDLIVIINESLETVAIPIKKEFPDTQVILCRGGGKKSFSPQIFVIHEDGHYDVHYFEGDWDKFVGLIGQVIEPLPIIFDHTPDQGCNYSKVHSLGPTGIPDQKLSLDLFSPMLRVSVSYLEWYLGWLQGIDHLAFSIGFKFPLKRGKKKAPKVKRVTIPITEEFMFRGMPVFYEDNVIIFFNSRGLEISAIVESVREEEIIVSFPVPIPRFAVNDIVQFKREVSSGIAQAQYDLCTSLVDDDEFSLSYRIMSGVQHNNGAEQYDSLSLDKFQARMLFQDRSQLLSLSSFASNRGIVLVQGPAGTGKSFMTSLAIKQSWLQNRITLLVSHSNQGTDNLVSFVSKGIGNEDLIFRLGNNADSITDPGKSFHRSTRFVVNDEFRDSEKANTDSELSKRETKKIDNMLYGGSNVVLACTMSSFLVDRTLNALRKLGYSFDLTFIDEASRGFLFEILPIVQQTTGKIVFIGDPEQLGNIDIVPDAREHLGHAGFSPIDIDNFSKGWFNCIISMGLLPVNLLNVNRRSLPVICRLISRLFYKGMLIPGRFDTDDDGYFSFFDTSGAQDNEEERKGTSYLNSREANIVVERIVKLLLKGYSLEDVATITPYRAQIDLIRRKLRDALFMDRRLKEWRKTADMTEAAIRRILYQSVNTVDAFQGSQRKVIILSFVRSNTNGKIGFNKNINRLRVALSRAEDALIIIGNASTFLQSEEEMVPLIFSECIKEATTLGTYHKVQ